MRFVYFLFILPLLIIFCEKDCESPTEPKNHSPEIQEIILSQPEVKVKSNVYITAIAVDSDRDSLNYYWNCSAGNVSHYVTSNPTYWRSPDNAGNYSITCTVSDGKETDTDSMIINVTE